MVSSTCLKIKPTFKLEPSCRELNETTPIWHAKISNVLWFQELKCGTFILVPHFVMCCDSLICSIVLRVTVYIRKLTKNNYGLTARTSTTVGSREFGFLKAHAGGMRYVSFTFLTVQSEFSSHSTLCTFAKPFKRKKQHEAEAAEKQRELNVIPSGALSSHVALSV